MLRLHGIVVHGGCQCVAPVAQLLLHRRRALRLLAAGGGRPRCVCAGKKGEPNRPGARTPNGIDRTALHFRS